MSQQNFRLGATVLAVAAAMSGVALIYHFRQPAATSEAPAAPAVLLPAATATQEFWPARLQTLAGDGVPGAADGPQAQARFADPYGVALDGQGNIYVADGGDNNRIRKITPAGVSSTLAGGSEGYAEGAGGNAAFHTPSGIAIDRQGNLYVADTGNHAIRKVTPAGAVTTLAGNGIAGFSDGKGAAAQFNGPIGVAVDEAGVVYVADTYNDRIRRIAPDGTVTTIAGGDRPGLANGAAMQALFDTPCALALGADGELFIADTRNNAIRKLGRDGMVSTVAAAREGDRDAILRSPVGLARTHDGYLYILAHAGRVLQMTPDGDIAALADQDSPAEPGGSDGTLRLYQPRGVAVARDGGLLVSDAATFRLHRIAAAGEGAAGGQQAGATAATPAAAPAQAAAATATTAATTATTVTAPATAATATATAATVAPVAAVVAATIPSATAAAAGQAAAPPPPARMLWPVGPQNQPHEVVGVMGEVRGSFDGESRDHFHSGLDIQADVGTPVLAVARAKVSDPSPNWGYGGLSEGISIAGISYIHMRVGRSVKNAALDGRFDVLKGPRGKPERVRVRRGTRFDVGDTLGTVNAMAHVHLDYYPYGGVVNPLTLPFIGLRDTVAPRIASITLFDAAGRKLRAAKRKPLTVKRSLGDVSIVVDAYDQMDGNEARRRLGLYKLGYQLLRADGKPVDGYQQPLITQVYDRLPRNREAVKFAYAANSGITVYGSKATRFAYSLNNSMSNGQVRPGAWNVAGLAPGDYVLRILAADYAGNVASEGRDLALTIE